MKNLSKLLTAALCICLMITTSACKKKEDRPIACIGTLPDTTYVNIPVHFSSCSQGNTTVQWHFGDSSVVLGDTVSHTYTRPGTYHGSMYASATNLGSSKDFTIVVLPDTPGYFIVRGKYYRPTIWANNVQGVNGSIAIYDTSGYMVSSAIHFYFYGADQAGAGHYLATYDYASTLQPGQVNVGVRLDTVQYGATLRHNDQISLDIAASGKKHIYGTDVWMVTWPYATDSFQVSFDLREP